jgi:hypothetical protein
MVDDFLSNFERQKAEYYERMSQNFQIYEMGETLSNLDIQDNIDKAKNMLNDNDNMQM